jgi:hypothetical protein
MKRISIVKSRAEAERDADEEINGRAMLASGREFEFTATNVTPLAADLCADVIVRPGETLVCHFEDIALLPGKIISVSLLSFRVAFDLSEDRFAKVAAQLESRAGHAARRADLRRAPRIVPLHKAVDVRLGDRIVYPGTILNISRSGAAILLDEAAIPFIDSRICVGSRFARVVRLMEGGIGVEFIEPFAPDTFSEWVKL